MYTKYNKLNLSYFDDIIITNVTVSSFTTGWGLTDASDIFKVGNVVIFNFNFYDTTFVSSNTGHPITKDQWEYMCTISVRPKKQLYYTCDNSTNPSTVPNMSSGRFRINDNGRVEVLTRINNIYSIAGSGSFRI